MCDEADCAFVSFLLVSALLIVGLTGQEVTPEAPPRLDIYYWMGTSYQVVVAAVDALLLFLLLPRFSSRQLRLLRPPLLNCFCDRFAPTAHTGTSQSRRNKTVNATSTADVALQQEQTGSTLLLVLSLQRKQNAIVLVSVAIILCVHVLHQLGPRFSGCWCGWVSHER